MMIKLFKHLKGKFTKRKFKYCGIHRSFDDHYGYANYYGTMYRRSNLDTGGPYLVDGMDVIYGYTQPEGKFINHRLDGPAHMDVFGFKSWYINDKWINDKIYLWAKENDIDLCNLSEVDKALVKIVWTDYGN